MPDTPPLDLAHIRAVAEAATPGPWFWNSYNVIFSRPLQRLYSAFEEEHEAAGAPWGPDGEYAGEWAERFREIDPHVASVPATAGDTATGRHAADAAHIAAWSPSVALTVLDRLERAEAALAEMRGLVARLSGHIGFDAASPPAEGESSAR